MSAKLTILTFYAYISQSKSLNFLRRLRITQNSNLNSRSIIVPRVLSTFVSEDTNWTLEDSHPGFYLHKLTLSWC